MTIFCTIYYVLNNIQTFPQIFKLLKTKSSNDYSLLTTILHLVACISWTLYIFTSRQSVVVYVGTVIDIVLLSLVTFLIFRYYNFSKRES